MSYNPLTIGSRAYKYIRSGAVRSIIDALVELITNSVDAYNKDSSLVAPHKICIKPVFEKKNKILCISVVDQAIGLTGHDLEEKFFTVGNYTSSQNSRGFFSRGAKDISNIGDVFFESIKDGKYSKIEINRQGLGKTYFKDLKVTNELRNKTSIINNGFKATINLLNPFKKMYPNQLLRTIRDHYALRNIVTDNKFDICIDYLGKCKLNGICNSVKFDSTEGKQLLVESTFTIASYDNAIATLKIYSTQLPNADGALLVKSDSTIYCKTCFDRKLINHFYMKRICGELHCNKIHDLLYDFEVNGSSEKNPFCIIDNSRGAGIFKDHPFIKELYKYPTIRLNQVLQEIEDAEQSTLTVKSNDISDLIDKLNIIGDQFELGGRRKYTWRKKENANIIRAVAGTREEYVNLEKSFQYIPKSVMAESINVSNNKKITGHNTGNSGSSKPVQPQVTIYERDSTGDLKKLTILESGELVDFDENDNTMFQTPDVKRFQIKFSNKENPSSRYDIYETSEEVVLRLYTNEVLVKNYLGDNINDTKLTTDKGKTFLSETIIEAFATLMTKNEMELDSEIYDTLNTTDMITTYNQLYSKNVQSIELLINNAIDNFGN